MHVSCNFNFNISNTYDHRHCEVRLVFYELS